MSSQLEPNILYIIQGYHAEHVGYLQRAIFSEAEVQLLKEQIQQEQVNTASTIQGLNSEIASLQTRLSELQNGSNLQE